jgi:hypothetical protein
VVHDHLSPPGPTTKSASRAGSISRILSSFASSEEENAAIETENPVLVIEDDAPQSGPPVRREEYRNLFSRLRSG